MNYRIQRDLSATFVAAWPAPIEADFGDPAAALATEVYGAILSTIEAEREEMGESSIPIARENWFWYHSFYTSLMFGGFASGVFQNEFDNMAAMARAAEAVGRSDYAAILNRAIVHASGKVATSEDTDAWLEDAANAAWLDELSEACDQVPDNGTEPTLLTYAMAHRDEFFDLPTKS